MGRGERYPDGQVDRRGVWKVFANLQPTRRIIFHGAGEIEPGRYGCIQFWSAAGNKIGDFWGCEAESCGDVHGGIAVTLQSQTEFRLAMYAICLSKDAA